MSSYKKRHWQTMSLCATRKKTTAWVYMSLTTRAIPPNQRRSSSYYMPLKMSLTIRSTAEGDTRTACGHIITKQIYTDGIVVLYRLSIVSLFSPLRIYFMIWITSNLVKACFIDHIKGIEQQEKHYTVNIDIFVCNL